MATVDDDDTKGASPGTPGDAPVTGELRLAAIEFYEARHQMLYAAEQARIAALRAHQYRDLAIKMVSEAHRHADRAEEASREWARLSGIEQDEFERATSGLASRLEEERMAAMDRP